MASLGVIGTRNVALVNVEEVATRKVAQAFVVWLHAIVMIKSESRQQPV